MRDFWRNAGAARACAEGWTKVWPVQLVSHEGDHPASKRVGAPRPAPLAPSFVTKTPTQKTRHQVARMGHGKRHSAAAAVHLGTLCSAWRRTVR